MTSPRQINSNRRNAQRATGPTSAAGREKASRNALRHGLTRQLDGIYDDEIRSLAAQISSPDAPGEWAMAAADAHLSLLRIKSAKLDLLNARCESQPGMSTTEAISLGVAEAAPEILRLNEYERKALSRRRKALREAN